MRGRLRTWCQADPDANLVFSPAVLASALGMAYLAAKGPTATAMAGVLHLPAQSRDALLAGLAARLAALRAVNGAGVTLAASDFAWADLSLPPLKSYLDDIAPGYDAGVGEAPFQADPQRAASRCRPPGPDGGRNVHHGRGHASHRAVHAQPPAGRRRRG